MQQPSAEDQEILERLRAKYSNLNPQVPLDPNAPAPCGNNVALPTTSGPGTAVAARPGSDVEARICSICQGTGTQVEEYNHRRLEKFCTDCEGQGVTVYKNGVAVQPGASKPAAKVESYDAQTAQQRREKHTSDLAKIEAKARAHEQERSELQGTLEASSGQERALKIDLMKHLDKELERLHQLKAKKEALLGRC